jgi:hypothetical protein
VEREEVIHRRAHSRLDQVAEHQPAAVETGLHGFIAQAKHVCCLSGREPFDVTQHEDDPVRLGQRIDGVLEQTPQFAGVRPLLGIGL